VADLGRHIALVTGVGALSWVLVGVIRRYSLRRGVLDQPTSRSSHAVPMPRGGGAGLVVAAIAGFLIGAADQWSDWRVLLAILATVPTAVVGWLDDHGSLPVLPRFLAHLSSGLLLLPLALLPGLSPIATLFLSAAWLFATVSAINVVNFMDGIDGLIGLQALIFGAHLALLSAAETPAQTFGTVLAAASAAFLLWNWSPARIFLGDIGSGALAVLGVIGGLLVWRAGEWPFVAIFLPLFPVFLDASVTLARRARRGEPLTVAHRTHLYQRLANEAGWGHARVSALYGLAAATGALVVLLAPPQWRMKAMGGFIVAMGLFGAYLDRRTRTVGVPPPA
jgi:Fuc2NAc and GlcNAc transferase